MSVTVNQLFDYYPGNHLLTEEVIYQQQANNLNESIPVFSGSENNDSPMSYICKGAVNKIGEPITYFSGPCILLTKDGSAGLLTLKQEPSEFTLNHHACVLKVKPEKKNEIDIEWFVLQFQSIFYHVCSSKSDNRVFTTKWFERLNLNIPDYPTQIKQKNMKKILVDLVELIESFQKQADLIVNKQLELTDYSLSTELIATLFNCTGGNSGLTEEFIYNNKPENADDQVEIITSATQDSNQMGLVSKKSILPNHKPLKVFNGESIIITRNGYAGTLSYISNKLFTTNDHAYVLTLKPKWKNRINVEWFAHQYQHIFKNVITSKSDNATFNKEWLDKIEITFPEKTIQDQKIIFLSELKNILSLLESYKRQVERLIYTPIEN
jgi:CRISPR/Cas system CMR-associated protein Cmr5 small subunit